jgi:hypothetical protein
MARMKDVYADIQDMADNGYDTDEIALMLEVDIKQVQATLGLPANGENDE